MEYYSAVNRNEVLIHATMWINLFFFLPFSRAVPTAYGGSQARGLIGAVAASLHKGHSNVRSEPHL